MTSNPPRSYENGKSRDLLQHPGPSMVHDQAVESSSLYEPMDVVYDERALSRRQAAEPYSELSQAEPTKMKRAQLFFDESHADKFSKHWMQFVIMSALGMAILITLLVYVIIRAVKRKAPSPLTPLEDGGRPKGVHQNLPPCENLHSPTIRHREPLPLDLSAHSPQPQLTDLSGLITATQQHEPVRIRTRGLLERRGSSASLTIDLSGEASSYSYNSPTRECSVDDYLSSAGNRLTRRQLRASLKNSTVLHQEFVDIPLNHPPKPSDLPGCNHKNRHRIWPNERTRVILKRKSSDPIDRYVNANYIRGYDDEPMAFIATQGPLANTVDDFWLLVWQEKVPCIVMMTKLVEKNKEKCEPYIPTKSGQYGPIHVSVRNTMPRNGYYVRELTLSCGDETRVVKHYWFTGWPDQQAAPTSAARQLLLLAQDVQNQRAKIRQRQGIAEAGPILVHCSAGVGRTGCFIAICIGCRQLQEENMVDILGVVCQMRLDRGGMIQTPEQYEFIHHALVVYEQQLCDSPTTAAMPLTSSSSSNNSSRNATPGT